MPREAFGTVKGAEDEEFRNLLEKNRIVTSILDGAPLLELPDWYLGAGCLPQTVWNKLHGFPPTAHIKDYDLVYFDGSDLSYQGEDSHVKAGQKLFNNLGARVEIRNQARVHLWYQERFGYTIEPHRSVEDAIASWPTTATSVGVRRDSNGRFLLCAPYGLSDIFAMIVRPNKKGVTREIYEEKAQRWARSWPKLTVLPWD
jgi:hypothetical protein